VSNQQAEGGGVTRLSFIKAGAVTAAGVAAVAIPAAAQAREQEGVVTAPSAENPAEPVMAYVRDAKRGEVTVMSGTRETTYRDPALVKRLVDRAPKDRGV
jgi:hypothetical protein